MTVVSFLSLYYICTLHSVLTAYLLVVLSDSLTIDRGRKPGGKFIQKMLQ